MKNKIRILIASLIFTAVFVFILSERGGRYKENCGILSVHFIDVGYGDCALIRFPDSEIMLIDCGDKSAKANITEYFKKLYIKKINSIIVTHDHPDHIGNLQYLISSYDVDNVMSIRELFERIKNKNVKCTVIKEGEEIKKPGIIVMKVLNPDKISKNENNSSLVLKLKYRNISFLFPADIGQEVCDKLSEKYKNEIKSDVLKVPYHGKAGVGEFIKNVSPELAVVSVGKSKWGGPYENILNEYKKQGIKVLRTDENGTIVVKTDGEGLWYLK